MTNDALIKTVETPMDFIDRWREQVKESLAGSAKLAQHIKEANLEYALVATGVLWPLRLPVREFDMATIQTVNQLLGEQAKIVLRVVQRWDDDMMASARNLSAQLANNPELDDALNVLIKQFNAYFIFTDELSRQAQGDNRPTFDADTTAVFADEEPTVESARRDQVALLPPRVFISYARSDGEDLARDVRQRLLQEGIPVWQDRVSLEGGRDWWLQITEALDQVEFMVLVATPAALRSPYVTKEWRYARQQGVCVYPAMMGATTVNFEALPRWMRNVHFYDLTQEWPKLVGDLKEPCQTPRVPFMAEELPEDFISRAEQLNQIRTLIVDENSDPVATDVALFGTGGYGKTLLATAVCHDEGIRQAFDDGVLWITLGEKPGDLTSLVVDLIEVLSGERPGFSGLDAAESRLVQLLADRDILMIIDDVWNAAHLKPFLRGGSRCARIITTRNNASLPPKTHTVEVEAMRRNEAVALLCLGLTVDDARPFEDLAERLGDWPLLLKLANSTLRDRVHNNNQPLTAALTYVNRALDKRGLTAFDARNAAARDQAVSQTLGVSQELLTDSERERYRELAIFPGETNIPLTMLQKLWSATGGLDDFDTDELCHRFHQLSLLAHFDPNAHHITLQNVVQKYLAQEHKDLLVTLHQKLLNAVAADLPVRKGIPWWAQLPHNDTYLWIYLAYHLLGAERGPELITTVKDLSYLATKTFLRTAYATEADLFAARQVAPDDTELTRLHQAFSQSSHLFNQADTLKRVSNTLHSRLMHIPALANLLAESQADLPKPLLTAARRLPDLPDPSQIRALGHRVPVLACAISADGSTAVSMARDALIRIWDANTGAERFTLEGHKVMGNSCAISDDGKTVASATWDGALKIWDADTGMERFSIEDAHDGSLFDCAISGNGSLVVTAAKDKTLKVWDANSGKERFTLTGHTRSVTGCDISADGATIVSNSADGAVNIWDANSGKLRKTIQAFKPIDAQNPVVNLTFTASTSALLSCAISGDGSTIVSVLPDGILKVWDANSGKERVTLVGHSGWIEDCAINNDGSVIVSVSNDKTIRGWDGQTGKQRFMLEGHLRTISGCALNAKGSVLATASQDKSLKLWDVDSAAEQVAAPSQTFSVQSCAISADGGTLAFDATGNTLQILDAQNGNSRFELKGHMRPVTGCVVNADGTLIVSASQDRTLKIWDGKKGQEIQTLRGHMWAVNDCALSRDGSLIVSGSEDSTLKIWDTHTGKERKTLTGHMRGVNGCAISPNGIFIVSASSDKTLKIWDTASGAARLTLTGHEGAINNCAISPDNLLIASAATDNLIKIWDVQTGGHLFTLEGHQSSVLQCAFSPNSKFLLSVSKDKTVRLWDVKTGHRLATLLVDGPLAGCAWYPDGQHIVVGGGLGVYFLQLIW